MFKKSKGLKYGSALAAFLVSLTVLYTFADTQRIRWTWLFETDAVAQDLDRLTERFDRKLLREYEERFYHLDRQKVKYEVDGQGVPVSILREWQFLDRRIRTLRKVQGEN